MSSVVVALVIRWFERVGFLVVSEHYVFSVVAALVVLLFGRVGQFYCGFDSFFFVVVVVGHYIYLCFLSVFVFLLLIFFSFPFIHLLLRTHLPSIGKLQFRFEHPWFFLLFVLIV